MFAARCRKSPCRNIAVKIDPAGATQTSPSMRACPNKRPGMKPSNVIAACFDSGGSEICHR